MIYAEPITIPKIVELNATDKELRKKERDSALTQGSKRDMKSTTKTSVGNFPMGLMRLLLLIFKRKKNKKNEIYNNAVIISTT